jgi:hypothetical protein
MTQIIAFQNPEPHAAPCAVPDRLKKPVLEGKRPGLKPGQKIRAVGKLKPAQIEAIVRAVRVHAFDNPENPLTYAVLEKQFQVTAVTLRSKAPIKAAMEAARATVSTLREAQRAALAASSGEEIKTEKSLQDLRVENRQLEREVENYRKDHQLLTLFFHMRGETLTQILEQANNCMMGNSGQSTPGGVHPINPISRK